MEHVVLRAYGDPKPQGSKTAFVNPRTKRAVVVDQNSKTLKPWRQDVQDRAVAAMSGRKMMLGPVGVVIDFYLPKPKSAPKTKTVCDKRPDGDKLLRAVLDSMTGVVYKDDGQIVSYEVTKRYANDEEAPGVYIEVYSLPPDYL